MCFLETRVHWQSACFRSCLHVFISILNIDQADLEFTEIYLCPPRECLVELKCLPSLWVTLCFETESLTGSELTK